MRIDRFILRLQGRVFEIFAIDLARDRVSIAFDLECESAPPIFGEIALNQPRDDSGLSTMPTHITWPAQYPGIPERDVAVRVNSPAGTRSSGFPTR